MAVGTNRQGNVEDLPQGIEIVYHQTAHKNTTVVDLRLDTPKRWTADDNVIRCPTVAEVDNPVRGAVAVEGEVGGDGNIPADGHRVDSTAATGEGGTAAAPGHAVIERHIMAILS